MQTLDYAKPPESRLPKLQPGDALLAAAYALLSLASYIVFMKGAMDEPFLGPVRARDMLTHVGISSVLLVAWLQLAVFTVYLVLKRRALPLWLLLLMWAGICSLYVAWNLQGYMSDVIFENQRIYKGLSESRQENSSRRLRGLVGIERLGSTHAADDAFVAPVQARVPKVPYKVDSGRASIHPRARAPAAWRTARFYPRRHLLRSQREYRLSRHHEPLGIPRLSR